MGHHRPRRLDALRVGTLLTLILGYPGSGLSDEEPPTLNWGRNIFASYCATCHGETGKGDGPTGGALKSKPSDLTQIQKQHGGSFPRIKVMQFIDGERPVPAHGSRKMPIWGKIFRSATTNVEARMQVFALTAFLESIQQE